MTKMLSFLAIVSVLSSTVSAFTSTTTRTTTTTTSAIGGGGGGGRLIATNTKLAISASSKLKDRSVNRRRRCTRCPEPDDDDDENVDRREALYAMVGALIGVTSLPAAAYATYGEDAKIELPNPIETISNRANGQCLVETLGNRECLVYLDPANKLYQGADSTLLLERVEKASEALATIPPLVESMKWSQVSGVLLGPLGTLVVTMNQLTKLSSNSNAAAAAAQKAKNSLYAIGSFVERKDAKNALEAHTQATRDLVSFVKTL